MGNYVKYKYVEAVNRYVQIQKVDLTLSENSPNLHALKEKHKVTSLEEFQIALQQFFVIYGC